MDLGRELADLRVRARKSQREIAKAAGVDAGHISRIERGVIDPSFSVVEKILAALGVPLDLSALKRLPSDESGSPEPLVASQAELHGLRSEIQGMQRDFQELRDQWNRFREVRGVLAQVQAEAAQADLASKASRRKRGTKPRNAVGGRKGR